MIGESKTYNLTSIGFISIDNLHSYFTTTVTGVVQIAGDIGITHMLQLINAILSNSKDNTQVSVLSLLVQFLNP